MPFPGPIEEEGFWGEEWGHFWTFGEADCAYSLMERLPVGLLWPRSNITYLFRVLNACGTEICNYHDFVKLVSDEHPFRKLKFMLPEWEAWLHLPEPCFYPTTVAERVAAVKAKFLSLLFKNASQVFFEQLAQSFGFTMESEVQNGTGMQIGDPIGSQVGPGYVNFEYTYTFSGSGNKNALECMFKAYLPMNIEPTFVYI